MQLTKIIIGELIVIFASVLIFRSLWTLMDKYLGDSNLIVFLTVGIVFAAVGMWVLNREVNCEIEKNKNQAKPA